MGTTYNNNRKVYLDIIKVFAIVLVLFNHTGRKGFFYFTTCETWLYPVSMFISILDKIAVPLFFMVSGALLIPKEESYRSVMKRFLRYLSVLISATAISYLYICLKRSPHSISIREYIVALYADGIIIQYWYLYAYLAYTLMLPFIRKLAWEMTKKDFLWFLSMYSFAAILTILDYTVFNGKYFHNENFSLFICMQYVFFPITGYFLDAKLEKKYYTRKTAYILLAFGFFAIFLCALLTHLHFKSSTIWDGNDPPFFGAMIYFPAIVAFFYAKRWSTDHKLGKRAEKMLAGISGTTFGLYLFERIVRLETQFIYEFMNTVIHPYLACWVWIIIACVIGGSAVFLVKQIPGIKKLI